MKLEGSETVLLTCQLPDRQPPNGTLHWTGFYNWYGVSTCKYLSNPKMARFNFFDISKLIFAFIIKESRLTETYFLKKSMISPLNLG